jgi:hypothetical protein
VFIMPALTALAFMVIAAVATILLARYSLKDTLPSDRAQILRALAEVVRALRGGRGRR